ncbi:MAG: hypothetical protein IRZ16_12760 [Myxococcaceae bacterium]|nr:hypothetical protein [Myxococcaceae bacterium]
MAQSTAGKGPGIVLRAQNRSGVVRVSIARTWEKAILEVLDSAGDTVEVGLTIEELRTLGRALLKVALALTAETLRDETTQR